MLTWVDLYRRSILSKMEGQQRWGFFMQHLGISWRLAWEYRSSQEETRHERSSHTAQLTCKHCTKRHSHPSCLLVLMDDGSMRQARLALQREWQLIYIPRTALELLLYTEICVTMTTMLLPVVNPNTRTAASSWYTYLQCRYIALAFSFLRECISSGGFHKDFQLFTCEGIKE